MRLILGLVILFLALAYTPEQARASISQPIYGVSGSPDIAAPDRASMVWVADQMAAAGVKSARHLIGWPSVQPYSLRDAPPSEWRWWRHDSAISLLSERGIEVVVRVGGTPVWASSQPSAPHPGRWAPADLDDWHIFVAAVAERYAGDLRAVEVRNEVELKGFWMAGDMSVEDRVAAYYETLVVASQAIREAAPHVGVLPAAITNSALKARGSNHHEFVRQLYRYPMAGLIDLLNVHVYGRHQRDPRPVIEELRRVTGLRKPVWVTETNPQGNLANQRKLARWFDLLADAGVQRIHFFHIEDGHGERQEMRPIYGLLKRNAEGELRIRWAIYNKYRWAAGR